MIENILYEIDNAFNESESNVADAIIESCTKALEILENSSDDMDVNSFGVYQEAVEAALKKEPDVRENNITRHVNFKKAKEETKKNLSKQRDNALNTKITKLKEQTNDLQKIIKSDGFKDLMKLFDEYPDRIEKLAKAFKECKVTKKSTSNGEKHVTEWTTGIIDDANNRIESAKNAAGDDGSVDMPRNISNAIVDAIVKNDRKISYTDMLIIAEYFTQKYDLTPADTNKIYEKLIDEKHKFIKDRAEMINVTKEVQKEYETKFKHFDNAINALASYNSYFDANITSKFLMKLNESSITKAPKSVEMQDRDYGSNLKNLSKYPASMLLGFFESIVNYGKKVCEVYDFITHTENLPGTIINKLYTACKEYCRTIRANSVSAASAIGNVMCTIITKIFTKDAAIAIGSAAGTAFGAVMFGPTGAAAGYAIGAAAGPIIIPKILVGILKLISKAIINMTASIT